MQQNCQNMMAGAASIAAGMAQYIDFQRKQS